MANSPSKDVEAHQQYRRLRQLHAELSKKPKPKLVLREIQEPLATERDAARDLQTPEE